MGVTKLACTLHLTPRHARHRRCWSSTVRFLAGLPSERLPARSTWTAAPPAARPCSSSGSRFFAGRSVSRSRSRTFSRRARPAARCAIRFGDRTATFEPRRAGGPVGRQDNPTLPHAPISSASRPGLTVLLAGISDPAFRAELERRDASDNRHEAAGRRGRRGVSRRRAARGPEPPRAAPPGHQAERRDLGGAAEGTAGVSASRR